MTIDNLGTTIRNKAKEEYRLEIEEAADKLKRALAVNVCCTYANLEEKKVYSINELLSKITDAAFKTREKVIGEKAIEDFLAQIESLQDKIEGLQDV